jgi:hypothetical protein
MCVCVCVFSFLKVSNCSRLDLLHRHLGHLMSITRKKKRKLIDFFVQSKI